MKHTHTLALTIIAGLLLTACGGTSTTDAEPNIDPVPAADTPEPVPTEEAEPQSERNNRGSRILQAGETEVLSTIDTGEELLSFTVHSIEVNPTCTGDRAKAPENGNFVVFDAEIESSIAAAEQGINPGLIFNSAAYRVIDSDGTTLGESANTGPSHRCFPESTRIPSDLGPGEKASGKVVFDVSVDSGSLLFELDASNDLQWEWEF